MYKKTFSFSSADVNYYFNTPFAELANLVDQHTIVLTDENVFAKHKRKFKAYKTIVIPAGEAHKNQTTVDNVVAQLIEAGADRTTFLVGVGGGVVTDITGYVAGIFMRGIRFGFVPTTVLAMVDAAIGGKNGVDVGLYKNMVGLIKQPQFLLFDYELLKTLPREEWVNGFAEIIKHACIKDAAMFELLEDSKITTFIRNPELLANLIQRNALLKTKVVVKDEFETGDRKLLNFGHTFGHAIENLYQIPHGHAISIGMGIACQISAQKSRFKDSQRVVDLLKKYGLPPAFEFDKERTLHVLRSDKKKAGNAISFVVLRNIGKASTVLLTFNQIEELIQEY